MSSISQAVNTIVSKYEWSYNHIKLKEVFHSIYAVIKMGNCMTTRKENTYDKKDFIIIEDDRPYEERSREEIINSETRQRMRYIKKNRWD